MISTSTALASRPGAFPAVIKADRYSRKSRGFTTLDGLQANTGHAQVKKKRQPEPTANLLTHWEAVMKSASKRGWHLLAEDIFDEIEESEVAATQTDTQFLIQMAADPATPAFAANTAIRLMGMLSEDDLLPRVIVINTLRDLLVHDDTQRRYYAAKALWQAKAREAVPTLRLQLDRESSEEVVSVLQRAIAVLEY